jgi:hypothetical protein
LRSDTYPVSPAAGAINALTVKFAGPFVTGGPDARLNRGTIGVNLRF